MAPRVVILMLDGLRRDFITPTLMPVLSELRGQGTWCDAHRSVFPSVTRVVSSSFATGCLPARHGLAGNTIAMTDPAEGSSGRRLFDAGLPAFVEERRRIKGATLAMPTMADRLAGRGGVAVYNNVSPGAAYLHDPNGAGHVHHRAGSWAPGGVPLTGERALPVAGDLDGDATVVARFVAEAVAPSRQDGEGGQPPAVALAWLGHPDTTQHEHPLGSPEHLAVLGRVDDHVRQVAQAVALARAGGDDILLLIGSDHGHQTVGEVVDIDAELIGAGLKESRDSRDVIVAPNGTAALIYTDDRDRAARIAAFVASRPWAGTVIAGADFDRHGLPSDDGLALAVGMAADDDAVNDFGVPGVSRAVRPAAGKADRLGCGQHGGLGRWEQSPFLLLNGRGFTPGARIAQPTSPIDVAPTVLSFLGVSAPDLDGRPLQGASLS